LGYAVAVEELEIGLIAIAAPVHRDDGTVIAAISVSGPSTRLDAARIPQVGAWCMAESSALSAALGHHEKAIGAA
jgi:DNA-binding IclR family transcriptional regulator